MGRAINKDFLVDSLTRSSCQYAKKQTIDGLTGKPPLLLKEPLVSGIINVTRGSPV